MAYILHRVADGLVTDRSMGRPQSRVSAFIGHGRSLAATKNFAFRPRGWGLLCPVKTTGSYGQGRLLGLFGPPWDVRVLPCATASVCVVRMC